MENVIEVTDANIDEVLQSELPLLLDFWAEWCPPCKMILPVIEELAAEYEGRAIIGKVDVDNNPQTSLRFQVRNAPTILILLNGEVVAKQVGAAPKSVFVQKLEPFVEVSA